MQVSQGEVIAGKYVIERVLGEGGMGIVVQATHVHLDERVAIKFLLPHALGNEEAVARFAREARAAVKIKSEHVARADVWALGAILYELLTGRVPFQADTMPQLCAMILQEAVTPPRSVRSDMPEGLQAVLLRCLEKNRMQRFQNVAEMAVALVPFAHRSSLRSAERISRVLSAAGLPSSAVGAGPTSLPPAAVTTSSITQSGFGKTLPSSGG